VAHLLELGELVGAHVGFAEAATNLPDSHSTSISIFSIFISISICTHKKYLLLVVRLARTHSARW
tara:strand:- start:155 stop:349 length:195 start_codon:yes stop_codon:yes gene_type:complete